jgi:protein-S-isoprenylcysteine O-methyltransferase Ste14
MDWTAASYFTYLAVTVPLTIWVASTLSSNGRAFLVDVFEDNTALADAINKLLVVGFYLLNVCFVLLYLRTGSLVSDLSSLMEVVSVKVGVVMVVLGLIHFTNVYVFNSIRRRVRMESLRTPPLPPQHVIAPAAPSA